MCGQPDNVFSEDIHVVKGKVYNHYCFASDNEYDFITIVAVKQCYETCRRNFLEEQEGKEEYVEMQSKKRKYRSRRQRVYFFLLNLIS